MHGNSGLAPVTPSSGGHFVLHIQSLLNSPSADSGVYGATRPHQQMVPHLTNVKDLQF